MDIIGFLPSVGSTIFTLIAFIVALSVIVAIHEYGHYIVGRWSGIKADVFSIGFGPVLWSRADKHGTSWQIAALPFGGFVKFKGDKDAASTGADEDVVSELTEEERRETMHGAPLWARTLTVAAGPVFNFILSLILFTVLALSTGVVREPLTVEEVYDYPLPVEQEVRPGDELLAVGGIALEDEEFAAKLDAQESSAVQTYTVLRDGVELTVEGPPLTPARANFVDPTAAAHEAGIREGDVIISIDGTPVYRFTEMIPLINEKEGAPVTVVVWRDGEVREVELQPIRRDLPTGDNSFETRWLIGLTSGYFFEPRVETPGIVDAFNMGVDRIANLVTLTFSGLYHMITGAIGSCNLSGPIGIAEMSGTAASQGLTTFIMFIGVLSTAVGLLNLFPIPVLDGGHLVFYAYEAVTRRPPSDKVLRVMMGIGISLMLALMAFALLNDVLCP